MAKKTNAPKRGNLESIVKSGTTREKQKSKTVKCLGADLSNAKIVKNRARRKQISNVLALKLAKYAESQNNDELALLFWNTYHCLSKVEVVGERMFGRYCKNRVCTVCSSIRRKEIMEKYYSTIATWTEPHFVTLTCKAVKVHQLNDLMDNMILGFHKIVNKYKKRHQRGQGKKLLGVRSLESNFNPVTRTYNPHFHLIVPDKETGDIFIQEWLSRPVMKRTKTRWTHERAQKNLKIINLEKCLVEVVKYSTKIFTDYDVKLKQGKDVKIYIRAMYNILAAMHGKRIFDRFGFDLPKSKKKTFRR